MTWIEAAALSVLAIALGVALGGAVIAIVTGRLPVRVYELESNNPLVRLFLVKDARGLTARGVLELSTIPRVASRDEIRGAIVSIVTATFICHAGHDWVVAVRYEPVSEPCPAGSSSKHPS